ncbi:uncharacterized protein FA14DRAFT_28752 [Meira miltonrushii]|uniref:Uncharacterized protein n=1 Tax=Meira miltonrushii TaxID=1280837 RepID=A0A316V1F7_9BASI|nr:uncharacterized protein FA14DRAFT_28752 [Meira miltonrushii]PWN31302.1 hypothetical protein FA14DRAFT_28752 [Meira miltonrushii]
MESAAQRISKPDVFAQRDIMEKTHRVRVFSACLVQRQYPFRNKGRVLPTQGHEELVLSVSIQWLLSFAFGSIYFNLVCIDKGGQL